MFLDTEHVGRTPSGMRDYYRAWVGRMLADWRFQRRVYAYAHNAPVVEDDDLAAQYAHAGLTIEPPVGVASGRRFSPDASSRVTWGRRPPWLPKATNARVGRPRPQKWFRGG